MIKSKCVIINVTKKEVNLVTEISTRYYCIIINFRLNLGQKEKTISEQDFQYSFRKFNILASFIAYDLFLYFRSPTFEDLPLGLEAFS